MKNIITNFKYNNTNNFNGLKYYFAIVIKECYYDTEKYFKIRDFLSTYYFLPKVLICENCDIFRDLNNICLSTNENDNSFLLNNSRVIITDDINYITNNSLYLFDINLNEYFEKMVFSPEIFDDNYTITKGDNPSITICILSLENQQFRYALISALKQNIDFTIIIIKNHTCSNAMNNLVNRPTTKYAVQMDEDMIFFDETSLDTIINVMKSQKENIWFYCFSLKDLTFGTGIDYRILGIKIFNLELIKKKKLIYENSIQNFAIDRVIKIKARELGLEGKSTVSQIGWHQKYAEGYDLFLRSLKMGYEVFNSRIDEGVYAYATFIKFVTSFKNDELASIFKYFLVSYSKFTNTKFDKLLDILLDKIKKINTNKEFYENHPSCKEIHEKYHINIDKHFNCIKLFKNITRNFLDKYNYNNIDKSIIELTLHKQCELYCLLGFLTSIFVDDIMDVYAENRNISTIKNFYNCYINKD